MANPQSLTNFVQGALSADLAVGGTTMTSAGLADLAAVTSPYEARIVLDPDGEVGDPEIVVVTAHTAAATTATITRAQDSTTAREHLTNTVWRHSAVASTLDIPRGRLAVVTTTTGVTGITGTSYADWAGMSITGVVGSRPVVLEAYVPAVLNTAGNTVNVEIYDSTAAAAIEANGWQSSVDSHIGTIIVRANVAPAAGSRTWKLRYKVTAGSGTVIFGSANTAFLSATEV